jgi:hypothetical protein
MQGFSVLADGSWSWTAGSNAGKTFSRHFNWLTADSTTESPQTVMEDSTSYLQFNAGKNFFSSKEQYRNFQLDVVLDGSSLDGDLLLVHHVQDAQNYDYMAIRADGSASLGRVRDGESETIEEGKADLKNIHQLRFVNSGEHQRGYVNGELILHGHVEPAPAGGVGLKPEGEGTLLVQKMQLSKLTGVEEHHEDEN